MRILHTYCLNYNIGDYALGIGVKNLLRRFLEVDFIGETNLQGRYFDEYYINEVVNKKYDLLVIGGGGIIHGAHWPNGWFWLINKKLIKTIKIPFIVYGAGNNYFENEPPLPPKTKIHLNETHKYATYFSVRNDGSYERVLNQTGIDAFVVPDPGFHVDLNTEYKRYITEPYVIIQLAYDKSEYRFGNEENKRNFIRAIKHVVKELGKQYRILFIPHVFDDTELSLKVADNVDNCEVLEFGKYAFDKCKEVIGLYKFAKFVLAMRGHGQILPIGFNVPIISLQNHPKHLGLMTNVGLSNYNVDINGPNFETSLLDKVDQLQKNELKLKNLYNLINQDLIKKTTNSFNIIKNRLNGIK